MNDNENGIQNIYSKINNSLIHIISRKNKFEGDRVFIVPDDQYLQVAQMKMDNGKKFQAHRHIPLERVSKLTQEAWVVIDGSVKVYLYDIDDTFIEEVVLNPGDCIISLGGGHNYESMKDDTLIYEFKLGPYMGIEKDKINIGK